MPIWHLVCSIAVIGLNKMENKQNDKFDILAQLAILGSKGKDLDKVAESSLALASRYVGLTAASFFLWDEKLTVTTSVNSSESEESGKVLKALEKELFKDLRNKKKLISAYLSFDTTPQTHSFTLPLRYQDKVFGAVIGLQEGERTLIAEDKFLESFSALISLNYAVSLGSGQSAISAERIDKERTAAIVELAVTINHEVNNPLTAILGNIQLLLLKRDDLDDDLIKKLKVMEVSANKIKDVTQKLLNLTNARSVEYTKGTSMLDLSSED